MALMWDGPAVQETTGKLGSEKRNGHAPTHGRFWDFWDSLTVPSATSREVLCKLAGSAHHRGHEATYVRPAPEPRGAPRAARRPPLPRRLHPAPLPDPPGQRRRPEAQGDRRGRR